VINEKVVYAFSKSSKVPMIEKICSFEVVEGMADEKIKGCDFIVAPIFNKEFEDDKKNLKNVVAEDEKETILIKEDCDDPADTVKQAVIGRGHEKEEK
jgi:hypothetical protein